MEHKEPHFCDRGLYKVKTTFKLAGCWGFFWEGEGGEWLKLGHIILQ